MQVLHQYKAHAGVGGQTLQQQGERLKPPGRRAHAHYRKAAPLGYRCRRGHFDRRAASRGCWRLGAACLGLDAGFVFTWQGVLRWFARRGRLFGRLSGHVSDPCSANVLENPTVNRRQRIPGCPAMLRGLVLHTENRKRPPRRWPFCFAWWWSSTPHQTIIESTESKRCGLLRTGANSIEKSAGTPFGRDDEGGFRLDWSPEGPFSLVCFPGPVQFPNAEPNPRPSPRPKTHPFTPIPAHTGPPCGEWRPLSPHRSEEL